MSANKEYRTVVYSKNTIEDDLPTWYAIVNVVSDIHPKREEIIIKKYSLTEYNLSII